MYFINVVPKNLLKAGCGDIQSQGLWELIIYNWSGQQMGAEPGLVQLYESIILIFCNILIILYYYYLFYVYIFYNDKLIGWSFITQ